MKRLRVATMLLSFLLLAWGQQIVQPYWAYDIGYTNNPILVRGIHVVNQDLAWAVGKWGSSSGIARVRAGFNNWPENTTIPDSIKNNYFFNDVWCSQNGQYVWIVGEKIAAGTNQYKGVVIRSMNSGATWEYRTPDNPLGWVSPIPFLKVRFASDDRHGYITCGNGWVLTTDNGGERWSWCARPDNSGLPPSPQDYKNAIWYYGLWVDDNYPLTAWIAGDDFGLVAKTTNAGANWTTWLPNEFQMPLPGWYKWQGAVNPRYGLRYPLYELEMRSYNEGWIAMGIGYLGHITNGQTFTLTNTPEPGDFWACSMADSGHTAFLTTGDQGVADYIDQYNNESQELSRYGNDFTALDMYQVPGRPDLTVAFAGCEKRFEDQQGESRPVRRRYFPAIIVDPRLGIAEDTINDKATVTVNWHANYQRAQDIDKWQIVWTNHEYQNQWFGRHQYNIINLAYRASGIYDTTWEMLDYKNFKGWHDFQVVCVTKDFSYEYWFHVGEAYIACFSRYPQWLLAPTITTCEDVPGDDGGVIHIAWEHGGTPPQGFDVCRATSQTGPFVRVAAFGPNQRQYWDKTQDSVRYYYRLYASSAEGSYYAYHVMSNTASAFSLNNNPPVAPGKPNTLWNSQNRINQVYWTGSSSNDVAGYFVCPYDPTYGYTLSHSVPINRTVFYDFIPIGQSNTINYSVSAVDWHGNVSLWSDIYTSSTQIAEYTNTPRGTALNNATKIIRTADGKLHFVWYKDNKVYYNRTTDRGSYWSAPVEIGVGEHPTIGQDASGQLHALWIVHDPTLDYPDTVQYPYPIPPPTPQAGTRRLMYTYTIGSVWQSAVCLYEDANTSPGFLLPPSLDIYGNTVHVVLEQCHSSMMSCDWSLIYGSFTLGNPVVGSWETVDSYFGFMLPAAGAPSMKTHFDGTLHLTWSLNGEIRYCYRNFMGFSPIEVLNQGHYSGTDPSICINGDEVNVVWSGNSELFGIDIFRRYRIGLWPTWGPIEQVSFTESPSLLPIMVRNNIIWCENTGSDYEIYRAWPLDYGWSPPENVSSPAARPTPYFPSVFPQAEVLTDPAGNPDSIFIIFTEKDCTLPYALRFEKRTLSTGDIPLFSYNLGTEIRSPVTLARSGYAKYGTKPYQTVDTDSSRLNYQVTGLDPKKNYAIGWDFYQKTNSTYQLKFEVDDIAIASAITVPSDKRIARKVPIPSSCLSDGKLSIKVGKNGSQGEAILSGFAIYDITNGKGGGGGGQDAEIKPMNERITFYLKPDNSNPFVTNTAVQYGIPEAGKISLRIYNTAGRMVRELTRGFVKPGTYRTSWDGKDNQGYNLPAGVYFFRLEFKDKVLNQKLVMFR